MSDMPISSRNDNASTFTVGCRLTKALIGSAANIMTPTDTITAATMIDTSSAMPTAVITESSENTMSSNMIWTITDANDGATRADPCPSSPSSRSWISSVALPSRNSPPTDQDQVTPRDRLAEDREERSRQPDDPGDREQQQNAHHHRRQQADPARA